MIDREKVIKAIEICIKNGCKDGIPNQLCPYSSEVGCDLNQILSDAIAILKEQEKLIRKLQNDKDKLCHEVSEWKHKFHDAPPKFVSQGVVEQIRWERDTALSQLEQIGKSLGSKMDDIVALLKEQDEKPLRCKTCTMRDRTGFCHRWNREVKDDDYCSFGAWKGC